MEDTLIYFGEPIKALDDNGRIGGHGIRFSATGNNAKKDLSGEYFTERTYLGPRDGDGQECIFHHGIPVKSDLKEFADHTFAPAKAVRDKVGIFVETVLDLSDDYEKAVFELAKKGKLGWSSGSASHRVVKNKDGEIVRWPVAEWSLTPQPCEPQNYGTVLPMKAFAAVKFVTLTDEGDTADPPPAKTFAQNSLATVLSKHIDDRVDDGRSRESIIKSLARESGLQVETVDLILADSFRANDANLKAFARTLNISFDMLKSATRRDYARTIKGMFEEALADNVPSRWQLDSIYCDLMRKIAATAQASSVTGVDFDSDAKIKEATAEYLSRLQSLAITQVNDYVESGSDEPFYLKAIINTSTEGLETDHLDLPQHSELVASAETGIMKRFRRFYETRIKAGRVLSDKTRKVVQSVRDNAAQLVSDCDALLEETKPMASDEAMRAAKQSYLRLKFERETGVTL